MMCKTAWIRREDLAPAKHNRHKAGRAKEIDKPETTTAKASYHHERDICSRSTASSANSKRNSLARAVACKGLRDDNHQRDTVTALPVRDITLPKYFRQSRRICLNDVSVHVIFDKGIRCLWTPASGHGVEININTSFSICRQPSRSDSNIVVVLVSKILVKNSPHCSRSSSVRTW